MADGWKKSKLSESVISSLVSRHLLQSKTLIQWQSAEGHERPFEKTSENFLFKAFVEHGLAVPVCDFLRGLLFCLGDSASSFDPHINSAHSYFCSALFSFSWNSSSF